VRLIGHLWVPKNGRSCGGRRGRRPSGYRKRHGRGRWWLAGPPSAVPATCHGRGPFFRRRALPTRGAPPAYACQGLPIGPMERIMLPLSATSNSGR
jgi:hypothetical protein